MRRLVLLGCAAGLAAASFVAASGTASAAAPTTYVPVTSSDLVPAPTTPGPGQFSLVDEGDGTGSVGTVTGPAPARGSLELTTTGTGSHWGVFNLDHDGVPLSDITALSYSTQTSDTADILDPTLQLVIDPGNTSGLDAGVTYSTLNFEPYLQPPTDPVVADTWQTWNVLEGVVWGTHLTGAPIGAPISWSTFLTDYPNATIIAGVGVGVGSGWGPMTGNVGTLSFGTAAGTTTYLFEPVAYLQITTSSLPAASVGSPYSASLSAIGGNPPYKWSLESGSLPRGLHLDKTTGVISGTPAKHDTGTSSFTVKVVDTKVKVKHHPPTQNSDTAALSITIS